MSDDNPDERSLTEIARDDAQMLYAGALDSGNISSFTDDEEAPAYAICFIENSNGEHGWVVIVARGQSWEGLEIDVGGIFDSKMSAERYVGGRLLEDEEEYEKRMAGDSEDDESEDDESADEGPEVEGPEDQG